MIFILFINYFLFQLIHFNLLLLIIIYFYIIYY